MKLREIAFTRCGDKGDISNVCVFAYRDQDWERLREILTVEVVSEVFAPLVEGRITRYEFTGAKGLNFVMEGALGGGVSLSLRTDPHGKSAQSLLLDLDI